MSKQLNRHHYDCRIFALSKQMRSAYQWQHVAIVDNYSVTMNAQHKLNNQTDIEWWCRDAFYTHPHGLLLIIVLYDCGGCCCCNHKYNNDHNDNSHCRCYSPMMTGRLLLRLFLFLIFFCHSICPSSQHLASVCVCAMIHNNNCIHSAPFLLSSSLFHVLSRILFIFFFIDAKTACVILLLLL